MPYPLPLTRTEAYLAYKAGVVQLSDLKPSLAKPRIGIDDWLAYWTGLKNDYPKNPDGTPKMLQEEEKYIAYLSGVTNTYPEKCLRRVGAYLRYLISARWGRPDRPLNREELYLSLIKTQFIPSGDPSSDIVIDGTAKAPFVDVKMYGDTFQQSYTGKNLANPTPVSGGSNGVFATYNSQTGEVTVSGTAQTTWSNLFKVVDASYLTAGTYTLKQYGELTNGRLTCYARGNGYQVNASTLQTTFTTTSDGNAYICITGLTSGSPVSGTIKFQLESGPTATEFEPFVNGQPSPNPSYPQQIQTVTGEQTVEIVGKNLIDPDGLELGNIDASGNDSASQQVVRSGYIRVAAGSYTLKVNNSENNINLWRYAIYDNSKTFVSANTPQAKSAAITIANNGYIRVSFYNVPWKDLTVQEIIGSQVQLELGSTATAYAPYSKQTLLIDLGSIELCKLGTYQDYIYKDGESWKVHKATNSITYDGTNYGFSSRQGTNVSGKYRFLLECSAAEKSIWDPSPAAYFTGVCDMLISGTRNNTYAASGNVVAPRAENSYGDIGVVYTDAIAGMTYEQANTWLTTHNMTVTYALGTPTDTTITDQTLIAQLDSLVNGGAEEGTTYIKVNATDPNLPGLLYVEAPKYD